MASQPPITAEPRETEAPPTVDASSGTGVLGRLPTAVLTAIILVVLVGFTAAIIVNWRWVVSNNEMQEQGDTDQLNSLVNRVDTLVLFVLGALFGVAAQSTQTASARAAADKSSGEAKKQHETAQHNAEVAILNKEAAVLQSAEVERLAAPLQRFVDLTERRSDDNTLFVIDRGDLVTEGGPAAYSIMGPSGGGRPAAAQAVDPELTALTHTAERALREARENRLIAT